MLLDYLSILTVTRLGEFNHTFEDISPKRNERKWRKKVSVSKVSEHRREK